MAGVHRMAVAAAVAVLMATVAGCMGAPSGRNNSGQLIVVAAENFWGNLAAQIGGSQVAVSSLISNPTADPHEFTSNTADELDVANAGLVIVNGDGYDPFMSKLTSAAPSSKRRVLTMADALHLTDSDANPHLWYDVARLPAAIRAISAAMTTTDPAHRAAYTAGAGRTIAALAPLQRAVAAIRQRYGGTDVAYTERVPGYLLAAAGLHVVTPSGFARSIEAGTDPSFADIASMRAVISNHLAKVLLVNEQAASPVTSQLVALAASNGIPVVPVTETMPAGDSFETWQLSQVRALATALAQ
jgi:zinc/manganese transport system substrate-binding protein